VSQEVIRLRPEGASGELPDSPEERDRLAARLVEAAIFSSAEPVSVRALVDLLQAQGLLADAEEVGAAVRAVIARVERDFEGRGMAPVEVAGGWQFRTAADLAPRLTKVLERPRRLPRSAMETLAIIAYHQPCTRADIEGIRGVSLGQQTLDLLLEAGLVVPRGRKEVPGRPTLWGTSGDFLRHFGLRDLRDLPRREDLLVELPAARPSATAEAVPSDVAGDADPSETAR